MLSNFILYFPNAFICQCVLSFLCTSGSVFRCRPHGQEPYEASRAETECTDSSTQTRAPSRLCYCQLHELCWFQFPSSVERTAPILCAEDEIMCL